MNWRNYNESLVKCGEVLLDFDIIDNWNTELEEMNKGQGRQKIRISRFIDQVIGIHESIFSLTLQTNRRRS
jgi:Transposase DDE domain